MKIIHIYGRSNSGKTTLIVKLVEELARIGRVGAIKHLGDHLYGLADGKDTTDFFSAGAAIAVGIDAEKSVAVIRNTSLENSLRLLHANGVDYAVVEGFKTHPYPGIVMGDLPSDTCILRNPGIPEILENLDRFPNYVPQPGGEPGNTGAGR